MSTDDGNTGTKLVNSVTLTLISRVAMIVATAALPIAGALMFRTLDNIQKVSDKVDVVRDQSIEVNGALKLVKQAQESQASLLADHEVRVRALESYNRSTRP